MMQWVSSHRRSTLVGAAALLMGCGSADSEKDLFEPVQPTEAQPPEKPPEETEPPPTNVTTTPPDEEEETPHVVPTPSVTPPGSQNSTGTGCKPALGVSGSPE